MEKAAGCYADNPDMVRGSGIVYQLHCMTITAFTASESSWRHICLVVAATHSDCFFAHNKYSYLLTNLFTEKLWL